MIAPVPIGMAIPAEARARAEAVPAELDALFETWMQAGPDHPDHIHALFVELYACTTRNWLARLARQPEAGFAYVVIPHFRDLYREHVLARLDGPVAGTAPHWRRYHRLARRLTIRAPFPALLLLVSLGARAHIYHDLGQAIRRAEAELATGGGRVAGYAAERAHLLSRAWDAAFVAAALDYVDRHRARQRGRRRLLLGACRLGLVAARPVWVPVCQHWRRSGYARLAASLPPIAAQPGADRVA
ncbi:hypothetical protein [Sinisalibacter aestuarii]|uniref:DUF2236 domain-containing protein n=1 Tax=Sinisalibacter aestuarii TaxID=2949426 RepID=A0ABQ5LT70_9RHOB|nr:hypothetical protein [Sinisalibacter aestuarii]GKY87943.1 hypothetical protein STA1M1_18120 [Sinisalibacter aestuarii]